MRHHRFNFALQACLALTAGALVAAGCGSDRGKLTEEESEHGLGVPDSHSRTDRVFKLGQRCQLDELVKVPAEGTPERVIQQLLEAATSEKDDDASFDAFASHFDESKKRDWVKAQYWPRARQHAEKYLQGDASQGVTFKVCRRDTESDGSVKIFIQSLDKKKSNPPMKLKKDEAGAWKVTFYTP